MHGNLLPLNFRQWQKGGSDGLRKLGPLPKEPFTLTYLDPMSLFVVGNRQACSQGQAPCAVRSEADRLGLLRIRLLLADSARLHQASESAGASQSSDFPGRCRPTAAL